MASQCMSILHVKQFKNLLAGYLGLFLWELIELGVVGGGGGGTIWNLGLGLFKYLLTALKCSTVIRSKETCADSATEWASAN